MAVFQGSNGDHPEGLFAGERFPDFAALHLGCVLPSYAQQVA